MFCSCFLSKITLILAWPGQPEVLLEQLSHDEYEIRERATEILQIWYDSEDYPKIASYLQHTATGKRDEAAWRAAKVFYSDLNEEMQIPIWSLPAEFRFVDGEDIALKYYLKCATKDENYFDNKVIPKAMTEATNLYLKERLDQLEDRKLIQVLISRMQKNWLNEIELLLEVYNTSHSQPLGYHTIDYEIPMPVEERLCLLDQLAQRRIENLNVVMSEFYSENYSELIKKLNEEIDKHSGKFIWK